MRECVGYPSTSGQIREAICSMRNNGLLSSLKDGKIYAMRSD
jgi:hypothetical protein